MKLQKYLQQLGYSRRKADDLAFTGRIMVNNQCIEQPWYEINEGDVVSIDGVDYVVQFETRFEYYVLNKPKDTSVHFQTQRKIRRSEKYLRREISQTLNQLAD